MKYFKGLIIVTAGKRGGFVDSFAPAALWFSACFAASWYRSVVNCLEFSTHESAIKVVCGLNVVTRGIGDTIGRFSFSGL